ncbi:hypothetical protein [Cellulomonas carbonis]|uniref:Replicase polyprotein 1ab n=1 Tax=Cellulomonas carbonis T26 TaxID=947969 RepID=A0A0A0BX62_9CELL|nr:hypothetical protein [Cellulomonas carbonis]KGM12242.1 hypothetical protein N868_01035 [Cellulomonas carbonis T26]
MVAADLDRAARSRLRTLSKDNADGVARHLVMAGRLLETDPEAAYAHAQAAVRRAGRVDVVREAAALTAYHSGRYAEALRELRTVRRLNGSDEHLPLMADCERGLGRPERAIAMASEDAVRALPVDLQVELAIVVSGARLDLADPEAAVAVLRTPIARAAEGALRLRVDEALADALEASGRAEEAATLRQTLPAAPEPDEDVVVFDLEEADDATSGEEADDAVREPSSDDGAGREGWEPAPVKELGERGASGDVEPDAAEADEVGPGAGGDEGVSAPVGEEPGSTDEADLPAADLPDQATDGDDATTEER